MRGNKKKSLGAKSWLYGGRPINSTFWPVKKALVWFAVWKLMVHNVPSSLVRFSKLSKDFRQTNCGAPLRIDRHKLLKRNSRHMTSFTEKTATIWFEVHLLQTTFGKFGSSSKTHSIDSFLFRAHTHRSIIRHLWRSYKRVLKNRDWISFKFLWTNPQVPFFERLLNCAGSLGWCFIVIQRFQFMDALFQKLWDMIARKCSRFNLIFLPK